MKRETLHWSASILKQLFEELDNTSGNNDNNFTVTTTVHVVSLTLLLLKMDPFCAGRFCVF